MNACIPLPLQIVIDDVGWWSGENGHVRGEPYRTGISRNHVPADYEAIALLGKQLNMRPQAAMVLCEWDRQDILRDVPTATWMGASWNNRWKNAPMQEVRDLLAANRAHVELALHGVAHEYWENGIDSRAEWYDSQGRLRPRSELIRHLDAFFRIYDDIGCVDRPQAFVPTAFHFAFGSEADSFVPLLQKYGIHHLSTPLTFPSLTPAIKMHRELDTRWFGVEHGSMIIDRGHDLLPWKAIGVRPTGRPGGPVIGMHWPNILHEDPARNAEIVDGWVAVISQLGREPGRMCARDSREFFAQLACHAAVKVEVQEGKIAFDFRALRKLGIRNLAADFSVQIEGAPGVSFAAQGLSICATENGPGTTRTLRLSVPDGMLDAALCAKSIGPNQSQIVR